MGCKSGLQEACCNNSCMVGIRQKCHKPQWLERVLANKHVKRFTDWVDRNSLLSATVLAVIFGLIIGVAVRQTEPTDHTIYLIGFPGDLFLRALKMMVIPLIIASVVSGTTALDPKTNGRMTVAVIAYFIFTSLVCAILGVFLVLLIHPGHPDIKESVIEKIQPDKIQKLDAFMDVLRNCLPENVMQAFLKQSYTVYAKAEIIKYNRTINSTVTEITDQRFIKARDGSNILGLIVFFMGFGAILSTMGEKGQLIAQYFYCLDKIIMKIVHLIIWFMPIGVASIICQKMASLTGQVHLLEDLVLYMITVVLGLAIHQFILLPLIFLLIVQENPFSFHWNIMQAIATAFATESSGAALPVTIENMQEKNHANKFVTKFILPIGATINMDGTALFVAVATLFIAQMNSHEATVGEILAIIFSSTAVSVASAATPGAALYQMSMVLSMLPNVPISDVALLLVIDWLLGRCRTTNNVVGDCYAVAIFQHLYRDDLEILRKKEEKQQLKAHPYLKHD